MACTHACTNTFGFPLLMRHVDCSRHFANPGGPLGVHSAPFVLKRG